jgi:hypothetical protein
MNHGEGRLGRSQVTSTTLGKEEMVVRLEAIRNEDLKEGAMWHAYPLLGGDREIDDCTATYK